MLVEQKAGLMDYYSVGLTADDLVANLAGWWVFEMADQMVEKMVF